MANTVTTGNKKKVYKSIRLAAQAAGVPYMTFYMRLRMGVPVVKAMKQPVRRYERQTVAVLDRKATEFQEG
jgi:hypothetical protein